MTVATAVRGVGFNHAIDNHGTGFFSGGRIKVGGRRRQEVPMLGSDKSTACRSVLVRVLHQKAVTRLR
ncbi:hypothetical protein HanXRQr2_Chr07g0316981 [Helianthus annuus]|uniref:Uncharacterized protein n=1 Tax=Helianthus annuus TaxID=4232 RepID=A0A9K3NIA2_HELAN|nr:hypothetical protein HanXRQr2_Chr07g0316981 [Helianthus annuus]